MGVGAKGDLREKVNSSFRLKAHIAKLFHERRIPAERAMKLLQVVHPVKAGMALSVSDRFGLSGLHLLTSLYPLL